MAERARRKRSDPTFSGGGVVIYNQAGLCNATLRNFWSHPYRRRTPKVKKKNGCLSERDERLRNAKIATCLPSPHRNAIFAPLQTVTWFVTLTLARTPTVTKACVGVQCDPWMLTPPLGCGCGHAEPSRGVQCNASKFLEPPLEKNPKSKKKKKKLCDILNA